LTDTSNHTANFAEDTKTMTITATPVVIDNVATDVMASIRADNVKMWTKREFVGWTIRE
jgi:hypothetical protein